MIRTTTILAFAAAVALVAAPVAADGQPSADSAAVAQTALDYIEGWYEGDAARMERALHPALVKRILRRDDETGRAAVGNQGASELILATARGAGTRIPEEARRKDVRVLDVFGDAATARVRAARWVDYLQMVRVDGEWKILNVLWETDEGGGG